MNVPQLAGMIYGLNWFKSTSSFCILGKDAGAPPVGPTGVIEGEETIC
jgi:hypothetical protein